MLRRIRDAVLPTEYKLASYQSGAGDCCSWVYELDHADQKLELYFLSVIYFYFWSQIQFVLEFTFDRNW